MSREEKVALALNLSLSWLALQDWACCAAVCRLWREVVGRRFSSAQWVTPPDIVRYNLSRPAVSSYARQLQLERSPFMRALEEDVGFRDFLQRDRHGVDWSVHGVRTAEGPLFVAITEDQKCCERSGTLLVAPTHNAQLVELWLTGKRALSVRTVHLVDDNDVDIEEAFGGTVVEVDQVDFEFSIGETFSEQGCSSGAFAGLRLHTDVGVLFLLAFNFHEGYYSHEVFIKGGPEAECAIEL